MSATVSIPKAGAGADLRKFMEKRLDRNMRNLQGDINVNGFIGANTIGDNMKPFITIHEAAFMNTIYVLVTHQHMKLTMCIFATLVVDVELVSRTEKKDIGMTVIRGNSVLMWECLDRVTQ
ncbi:hypothetical protein Pmar_PMAR002347 [Perkinsus marinus ATCC 50983]|uniref:Uncharacterized protein n=1 Tax=Perkinsus marinus (strain ATCC 50983 / TXsc) TaxID=423536 RepID=C5KV23_PERM5|nr:hypothetical protein Pmar_PMAR002347 [Perkinsus marinus ATCC 50983]EER11738.1 hypothetical protein Pmar_PMAR002347 [Perkinsus marinus ATCC 50983]|eukprot:XP_002779943.1 hypothetical protein Pmar_PMAR002347 [Perkinsus marinus ATCC 50983]